MHLQYIHYFVALAREKHFSRAADACCVTQPTFSAGITKLEALLGKRLVVRDRRFLNLTAEGHAILPFAQQIVADHEALRQASNSPAGQLHGELKIGAIPAAMPSIGHVVSALHQRHPSLELSIRSLTSREIERALHKFELDVGITYLDNEPPRQVRTVHLYSERFLFATRRDGPLGDRASVNWIDIVGAPLCLLHQGMQNRRILNAHLAKLGLEMVTVATADSYVALLSSVLHGGLSSIVTDSHSEFVEGSGDIRLIEISDPAPPNNIGLVVLDRDPLSPLVRAAIEAAHSAHESMDRMGTTPS